MSEPRTEFEYIVVGSGAGGGTVAARLAEAGRKVLVIEAGGDPKKLEGSRRWDATGENTMPDDYDVPVFHALSSENSAMSWDFWVRHYASQQRQTQDRKYKDEWAGERVDGILYPRTGALGGCTAHNAMILIYPHNKDWDDVAELTGDPSWKSGNMRRYFERMEDCHYRPVRRWLRKLLGWNPTRHGFRGWLSTQISLPWKALAGDKDLVQAVVRSARVAATRTPRFWHRVWWFFKSLGDPNDWRLVEDDAVGIHFAPLTTHNHRRNGTREFLLEIQEKYPENLTIELDALATRVLFDERKRAVGVEYIKGARLYQAFRNPSAEAGEKRVARASREVILAGGAFNTPQLLMLSGIGPRAELERHGIEVLVPLEGVGKNLQDRYEVGVVNKMKQDWEVLAGAKFKPGDRQYEKWRKGKGVYTGNGAVLAVIKRSSLHEEKNELPDLFIFALVGRFEGYQPDYSRDLVDHHDYLTWAVLKGHTINRAGEVTLDPADPLNPRRRPVINFHYFEEGDDKSEEKDLEAVVDGVEFVRKMTSCMRELIEREELPGDDADSRAEVTEYVRNNAWGHHASCTCPIGRPDDPKAVLDNNFRVYGTQGLRVVDASVFPRIPGLFIVSSVYMVGEKAADVILADAGQAPPRGGLGFWAGLKAKLGAAWRWTWRIGGGLLLAVAALLAFSYFGYEPLSGRGSLEKERGTIDDIVALLSGKLKDQYGKAPQFLRDTHPKANACVKARFTVERGLDTALNTAAASEWWRHRPLGDQGLFARSGLSYDAWLRFSNAADAVTDDDVEDFRGLAMKLVGVEGEKLPVPSSEFPWMGRPADDDDERLTQDFLFIAHDAFFAGNPKHFHDFFAAAVRGGGSSGPNNPFVVWHLLTHPRGAFNATVGRKVYPSLADIRWFSVAPFHLGEGEVKYGVFPCESRQYHPPNAVAGSPDYLAGRLRDRLDPQTGRGLCLEFNVQFRSAESQPIDDTLVAWKKEDSPWHRVATIQIEPQIFNSPEQAEFCQNITFNPWHSLPAHEPIGGINRARRDVMFALQKVRLEANGRKRFEPTGEERFCYGAKFPWLPKDGSESCTGATTGE
jgi:choline dehydrogenase-like flavoprotein